MGSKPHGAAYMSSLTLDMPFTFRACSSVSEKAGLDQKACQGEVPIIPFHDGIGIETLRW